MSRKGQHVIPKDGRWAVKAAGSTRVTKLCKTQARAVKTAKKIAKNQKTELVIHGRDGRIREKSTYGRDPFPPRG